MRKFIIRLFGGVTKEELQDQKTKLDVEKEQTASERRHLFRVGDQVYINSKRFNPSSMYYLIESYNNGYAWYISSSKDSNIRNIMDGVHISDIQFEKIEVCTLCKNKI